MSNYVSDTKAGKSVSAYLILNKKGERVATVKAHFSDSGVCLVNIHDKKAGFQYARASGYGYDKFTSALHGLTIDGHVITDHCSAKDAPKLPKGRKTYPSDFKTPKGYELANFTCVSVATGFPIYEDKWATLAMSIVGENAEYAQIRAKVFDLKKAWEASDDCESGFGSCHKISGLAYLRAFGYRVEQVL